jgi:hypothetical protein
VAALIGRRVVKPKGHRTMKTTSLIAAIGVALGGLALAAMSEGQAPLGSSIIEVPVAVSGALGNQIRVECAVTNKGGFIFAAPVEVGVGRATRALDGNGNFNGVVQVAVQYRPGDSYQCHLQVQDPRGRFQDARQAGPGSEVAHAARDGTSFRAEHWDWATFR